VEPGTYNVHWNATTRSFAVETRHRYSEAVAVLQDITRCHDAGWTSLLADSMGRMFDWDNWQTSQSPSSKQHTDSRQLNNHPLVSQINRCCDKEELIMSNEHVQIIILLG
jgi:hypothetical protein